nr:hypothetical protein [uncultured Actinoplanes sp.]
MAHGRRWREPERVRRDRWRQPRWFPWVMLVSAACTCASLLSSGPSHRFGGPVLYVVVLCGSGALLVVSIVLLVLRRRS